MNAQKQNKLIKNFISLIGVASASVLLGFPALAFINNPSSSNAPRADSTARNRQLVAQNTTGTTQQNQGGTTQQNQGGTTQQNPGGTTQQNPGGTTQQNQGGTTQQNPGGTTQQNPGGTTQQNPGGTTQQNQGGTTQQNQRGNTQQNQRGNTSGTAQPNGQRNTYTQYMNSGYAATQRRDYQSALDNFERALEQRPDDPYATRAIRNVRGYLQRSR
jgi:hypothetical protein